MEKYDEIGPRAVENFEKKIPGGLVKAVEDDIFGAFMIQCTLAGIQPRSMVSKKFFNWLLNKDAYGILAELIAKIEKKGSVEDNLNTLLFFSLKRLYAWDIPIEKIEKILTVYKREVKGVKKKISKIIRQTDFVDRVYFRHYQDSSPEDVYEMFEHVFPGKNLFPNPRGSWTDPRDGKTYETRRVFDTEYVTAPIGNPITFREFNPDIIPSGWRLPGETDMETAAYKKVLDLKQIMTKERFGMHVKESYDEWEHDAFFIPIEARKFVTEDPNELNRIVIGDLHIDPNGCIGFYSIDNPKKSYKVSVMICRDVK
jgi:hypothetical protein